MSTDKSDVNPLYCKFDNNDKSVVVAFDVEYIVLVSHVINAIEVSFDIGEIFPTGSLDNFQPLL